MGGSFYLNDSDKKFSHVYVKLLIKDRVLLMLVLLITCREIFGVKKL